MLYYLDTVVVIYAVEGVAVNQQRATNHIGALERAGHRFAVSDLTRTECLVPVLGPGAGQRRRTSSASSTARTSGPSR
ncbi:MAG: hypothetical protein C0501_14755 [Isosphaera sp.]|nr:hypothetical protein [Isosphaera sp.]